MEYKLKISDVIKVVIFVASLLGMWYSTKYQVDALTEKVSKLERQLEETNLGVIKNGPEYNESQLNNFTDAIDQLKSSMDWNKKSIENEFFKMIPKFGYHDNGKYLDGKM